MISNVIWKDFYECDLKNKMKFYLIFNINLVKILDIKCNKKDKKNWIEIFYFLT